MRRGDEVALVDTLMREDHADLIEAALRDAGAGFGDLQYVVLTHHHPDHSGGLAEITRRAPQAQVLCGAEDLSVIAESTGVAMEAVRSTEAVLGLEAISTPGHTPGHLCLFDAVTSTMLLGDVAANSGHLQRAPARFTEDLEQYERTLRSLAERQFDRALPSHGDPLMTGASAALLELAATALA